MTVLLHGPTADSETALAAAGSGLWNSLPSHLTQRCRLIVQSVPAATKDIFVEAVGPRRSVNHFNCAMRRLEIIYLLTFWTEKRVPKRYQRCCCCCCCCYQIRRLCRFSADRYETFHTYYYSASGHRGGTLI